MNTSIEDVVAGMALLPLHLGTYTDGVHAVRHFLWAYVAGTEAQVLLSSNFSIDMTASLFLMVLKC